MRSGTVAKMTLQSMPESKAKVACGDRSKCSLKKSRFAKPLTEVDMTSFCKQVVPSNTRKQTDWLVEVFESWRSERDGGNALLICCSNVLSKS